MSLSLKNIKGDIGTAYICLSPLKNLFNDEALYNNAAYHAEQATEKCIKYVLSNYYGIEETARRFKTHNIPDLLAFLRECAEESGRDIPIDIPDLIDELSVEIMEWEANSRYNDDMVILRKNIKMVLQADEKMYKQLQKMNTNPKIQ